MPTLKELMDKEDAERLAEVRTELAAEKAAWDALPQSEKDRITAEREAYWAKFDEACKASEDAEFENDEDDDETEEDD